MNLFRKCAHSLKLIAITLSILVGFLTLPAQAETCLNEGPVPIKHGSFSLTTTNDSPAFTVRSAIVDLPVGESGTIDKIAITGPDGEWEFGCGPIRNVTQGVDLIRACGGPAVLKAGKTTYSAKGSNFQPEGNTDSFAIKLCDDFQD